MNTVALSTVDSPTSTAAPGSPCSSSTAFRSTTRCGTRRSKRSAEHCRVIAPDLRGFGQSPLGDVDPTRGISMEQYADDLAELLDALQITEPIVLVGFSMGGYIAWQFVRKYRDRLRALVQCDTRPLPTPTKPAPAGSRWPRTLPSGAAAAWPR